jgi:hypothetical protein
VSHCREGKSWRSITPRFARVKRGRRVTYDRNPFIMYGGPGYQQMFLM